MTSMQRVLTTLGHQEPDRVPLFLLLTMHGARELGLPIQEYFSTAQNVVEGQLRLRRRYGDDCLYTFFYAPIEVEAWGGEVIYREDGPPNSGEPFIQNAERIPSLTSPRVEDCECLRRVLEATAGLKRNIGDQAPIVGVVMSPFSIPVMQLGFERYLDLMQERPHLIEHLWQINLEFCLAWANAQLAAGATAICYFDPISSASMVPPEDFRRQALPLLKSVMSRIQGPVAIHMASGRSLPILDDLAQAGPAVLGVSAEEDLGRMKAQASGRITLLGSLNGVAMRRWSTEEAEKQVKNCIAQAGAGGGFILSDNHGEIPWQVPDETLMTIAEATRRWGRYPLECPSHDN